MGFEPATDHLRARRTTRNAKTFCSSEWDLNQRPTLLRLRIKKFFLIMAPEEEERKNGSYPPLLLWTSLPFGTFAVINGKSVKSWIHVPSCFPFGPGELPPSTASDQLVRNAPSLPFDEFIWSCDHSSPDNRDRGHACGYHPYHWASDPNQPCITSFLDQLTILATG